MKTAIEITLLEYEKRVVALMLKPFEIRACELAIKPFEDRIEELRYNPYHDTSNGRFTSSSGGGSGNFLHVGKGEKGKGVYVVSSEQFTSQKPGIYKENFKKDLGIVGKNIITGEILRQGEERLTKIDFDIDLPELEGTEKQISYANDIRKKVLTDTFQNKVLPRIKGKNAEKIIESFNQNGVKTKSINGVAEHMTKHLTKDLTSISKAKDIIEKYR